MLLIHGEKDDFVPIQMMHELLANAPKNISVAQLVIPEAGHADSWLIDQERYESALVQLLSQLQ